MTVSQGGVEAGCFRTNFDAADKDTSIWLR